MKSNLENKIKLVKKILINITNGFSLRYICHTDILSELSKNYKIILLSKNANSTKKY